MLAELFFYKKLMQITDQDWEAISHRSWLIDMETEFELGLIEDIDTLAQREKEEFIGNRVIAKNPENDWENNYFDEEYFDN